jgi:hypothetical protein
MRYVAAISGAVFVFVAVLICGAVAGNLLPPAWKVVFIGPLSIGPLNIQFHFTTGLAIGFALAILASVSSYRSTLRHYRKKDLQQAAPATRHE